MTEHNLLWAPHESNEKKIPYQVVCKKYSIRATEILIVIYNTETLQYQTRRFML